MLGVSVSGDVRELSRDLKAIRASIPKITARALNETAAWAKAQAITDLTKELRVPRQAVARTSRKRKGTDRFRIAVRATAQLPLARIDVISEGIQVTDVQGAAVLPWNVPGRKHTRTGGGVKAAGGRFYKGAFKGAKYGTVRVWKMRSDASSVNPGKRKLALLRIGTKKKLQEVYDTKVAGGAANTTFRQRFQRMANLELQRRGFR